MTRFSRDPQTFFNNLYQEKAPWDIGAPQPAMVGLLDQFPPAGPILELGCGTGDLVIYLAQLGFDILGLDFAPAAIRQARAKARALSPEVAHLARFKVAPADKPASIERRFGAILDCGFYHLFEPEQCDRLSLEIAASLRPGGRYYLHAFGVQFEGENMPRQINAEEIRTNFSTERGWAILDLQPVDFLSRVAPPVPAVCACIARLDS